jgi:formylglycine-generating enzyme required for sulfatase activity
VNFVSYWDSCRFANWLGNGQGDGDTETGAYTLNGYNGSDGRTIQRNAGATWAVTSEDEWYKAAYYDPNKAGGAGYWDYPTKSNSINTGMANYGGSVSHTTDVGSYGFSSAYGTFDQGGNVFEWTEAIVAQGVSGLDTYATRGTRGGNWSAPDSNLRASFVWDTFPSDKAAFFGFRVSEVPEPSSIIALLGALVGFLGLRRHRA